MYTLDLSTEYTYEGSPDNGRGIKEAFYGEGTGQLCECILFLDHKFCYFGDIRNDGLDDVKDTFCIAV